MNISQILPYMDDDVSDAWIAPEGMPLRIWGDVIPFLFPMVLFSASHPLGPIIYNNL